VNEPESYNCPECGAPMQPTNPADPNCEIWFCGECGFNDLQDAYQQLEEPQ
jgi:ribosomal protein L37AE/L43A